MATNTAIFSVSLIFSSEAFNNLSTDNIGNDIAPILCDNSLAALSQTARSMTRRIKNETRKRLLLLGMHAIHKINSNLYEIKY